MEDILKEIEDQQRRSHNIVIYNLPESRGDGDEARKLHDLNRCFNIISAKDVDVVSCYRIGKMIENKPRFFFIKFKSIIPSLDVLKKCRPVNNIYVNRDLTERQRNVAYIVRQEFRRRKDTEANIKLRYSDGMPRIVTVGNA